MHFPQKFQTVPVFNQHVCLYCFFMIVLVDTHFQFLIKYIAGPCAVYTELCNLAFFPVFGYPTVNQSPSITFSPIFEPFVITILYATDFFLSQHVYLAYFT